MHKLPYFVPAFILLYSGCALLYIGHIPRFSDRVSSMPVQCRGEVTVLVLNRQVKASNGCSGLRNSLPRPFPQHLRYSCFTFYIHTSNN
jgi:hypothetical protein